MQDKLIPASQHRSEGGCAQCAVVLKCFDDLIAWAGQCEDIASRENDAKEGHYWRGRAHGLRESVIVIRKAMRDSGVSDEAVRMS